VIAGRTVYTSGQIPLDPATGCSSSTATSRRRRDGYSTTCAAVCAGGGWFDLGHVARVGIYLMDLGEFRCRQRGDGGVFPARRTRHAPPSRCRPQLKVAIGDVSGQTLMLRFFHFNRAQAEQLRVGARVLCYGEVRHAAQGLEMVHPSYQRLSGDELAAVDELLSPVYPTTEGLGTKRLAGVITKSLALLPPAAQLELIPPELCAEHGLTSLRDALLYVHRPPPDAHLGQLMLGHHPAQQRLAFEELLTQHLSLKRMRAAVRRRHAPVLGGDGNLRRQLLKELPFSLTAAQQRVTAEVARDLAQPKPMLRLVQGDVGSGKTVVAALAALAAIEAGQQVALMAPTELLAEQHLRNFRHWLQPLGVAVEWLVGKQQGKARQQAMQRIAGVRRWRSARMR
jgi:ATP-dependent DNA helicase RecG